MKKVIVFIFISFVAAGIFLTIKLSKNSNATASTPTNSPSVQAAVDTNQEISLDEVAKHADQNDCWMVIDNKVYDITQFIPRHPGGRIIVEGCGKDATDLFNTHGMPGGRMHSALAKRILAGYQIGVIRNK